MKILEINTHQPVYTQEAGSQQVFSSDNKRGVPDCEFSLFDGGVVVSSKKFKYDYPIAWANIRYARIEKAEAKPEKTEKSKSKADAK